MKFRNIIIASLALFAFASCSKDEGNEPEKPRDPVDAVFSIQLSDLATKAGSTALEERNERYIQTLNTYVFKESGQLAAYKRSVATEADGPQGISEVMDIVVKVVPNADYTGSADKFVMVLVANIADKQFDTLSDLEKATLVDDIRVYNGSTFQSLPMVSNAIAFENLHPSKKQADGNWTKVENWVRNDGGVYPNANEGTQETKRIQMKRLVARVQIDKIDVDMTDRYPGASFRLLKMSVANVRKSTTISAGLGDYLKGYQSENFAVVKKNIVPDNGNGSNIDACFAKDYTDPTYYTEHILFEEPITTPLGEKIFSRYIFTNKKLNDTDYDTGVLLSGYFKISDKVVGDGELRHFWIPLKNKNGETEVLPNTIYQLQITINGEGSKNEDNPEITAGITAKITVEDWKIIYQTEQD